MIHAGRSSLVSEYLALDDSKAHVCNNILLTMLDSEYDSSPFLRVSSNFEASSDNLEVLSQFSSGGDITRSSGGLSSVSFGSNSESVRPQGSSNNCQLPRSNSPFGPNKLPETSQIFASRNAGLCCAASRPL